VNGKSCVLAYSGGLDTSAIVPWLIDRGYTVHAVLVNVGQSEDYAAACQKALRYGAASAVVKDARPAMFASVVPYAIGLAATYEGNYRLGTALARPFIAAEQVKLARQVGDAALGHGATGKGNDQVRFEFAYKSLAPDLPIVAPWKLWNFTGRSDLIRYLQDKGFDDDYAVAKDYSLDENLWHLSVEGGPLEDPAAELNVADVLANVESQFYAGGSYAAAPKTVRLQFQRGIPTALNGRSLALMELFERLNRLYRHAPWAWDLIIENRFTGIKSRGIYINPAAKLLHLAVDSLARTCFNKPTYDWYCELGRQWAATLYRGEYFTDQRVLIEAAADTLLSQLCGTVTVQLEPLPHVVCIANGASIFTRARATFDASDFAHADAAGFINLTWAANIGKPFSGEEHGIAVETKDHAAPDVCGPQRLPAAGLVPAAP